MKEVLDKLGVKHETTIPYSPQQNGRAERINRTLMDKARCLISDSKLPKEFWAEAIATGAYLTNRSPKRCLDGKTPEELWTGAVPDLTHLRIFGCKAYAHVPKPERTNMDPTSKECIKLQSNPCVYLPFEATEESPEKKDEVPPESTQTLETERPSASREP